MATVASVWVTVRSGLVGAADLDVVRQHADFGALIELPSVGSVRVDRRKAESLRVQVRGRSRRVRVAEQHCVAEESADRETLTEVLQIRAAVARQTLALGWREDDVFL